MKRQKTERVIEFKRFGELNVNVFSLHYGAILVLADPIRLPKGLKISETKMLEDDVEIPAGSVCVSQRKQDGNREYFLHENGIYEALRGRQHTMKGYGKRNGGIPTGERNEIEVSDATLRSVLERLLRFSTLGEEEKREVQHLLAYVTLLFEGKTNEQKQEAYQKLATCVSLKDSRGRVNPGATAAKITAARTRLTLRLGEIQSIVPHIAAWELVLEEEKNRSLTVLQNVFDFCGNVLKSIHSKKALPSPNIFALYSEELKTIVVNPFLFSARLLLEDLREARVACIEKKTAKAQKALDRVYRAIRFKFAQREMEEHISWFEASIKGKEPEDLLWAELEEKIKGFRSKFDKKLNDKDFFVPVLNDTLKIAFEFLSVFMVQRNPRQVIEYMKYISNQL